MSINLFYIIIGRAEKRAVIHLRELLTRRAWRHVTMERIDARGRSCPQPVIMTKAQIESGARELEVLLDNAVSASNVKRFLESRGYSVLIVDEDGNITIQASAGEALLENAPAAVQQLEEPHAEGVASPASTEGDEETPTEPEETPEPKETGPSLREETVADRRRSIGILITRPVLGGDDPLLGEVLMKSLLGTLSQVEPLPEVIALMNEGVRLAVKHTSSLDHLSDLERKGVRILVCGTCTSHLGLTTDIGAGVISNMFEITEALLAVDRTLSL